MKNNYILSDICIPIISYSLKIKSILLVNKVAIDANMVFKDFQKMIEDAKKTSMQTELERLDYALFAVCVFIDEQFLSCEESEFQITWQKNTLQKTFYQTTNGGVIFFNKLNEIKDDSELKDIYEYTIALGFKGAYYQDDDQERLENIKKNNLENINLKLPTYLFDRAYSRELYIKKEPLNLLNLVNILIFSIPLFAVFIVYLVLDFKLDAYYESITGVIK